MGLSSWLKQSESGMMARCSLSNEMMPREMFHVHRQAEDAEIRAYTLRMIKSHHPEWIDSDGAREKCRNYHEQL